MSGGTFDYRDRGIGLIADEIERVANTNADGYDRETIAEFRRAVLALRVAEVYARRIDWLLAADDSEATFHHRLEHDLAELES